MSVRSDSAGFARAGIFGRPWSLSLPERTRFEELVLPHLDAGYNLARWLARDAHDAEDVVQDACLRALKYFDALRGGDARAWFLTIVRHIPLNWNEGWNAFHTADVAAGQPLYPDPATATIFTN